METLRPILEEHPFFQDLEPDYFDIVVGCASNIVFSPEALIYSEGDPSANFYLIREGRVGLEINIPSRGTMTIQTIDKGEILGWSWLIPPYKCRFTARAFTKVRAIAIDGECLRKKCDEDYKFGYEFYKRFSGIIVQRLQATHLQLLDVFRINS
ncbi:MAG: cyclic nucleotide-binding domain-containing protein [FCB group bacterium]|nr:cyclic nucleotide-binding domain-containing protein [FCB group bacterium]